MLSENIYKDWVSPHKDLCVKRTNKTPRQLKSGLTLNIRILLIEPKKRILKFTGEMKRAFATTVIPDKIVHIRTDQNIAVHALSIGPAQAGDDQEGFIAGEQVTVWGAKKGTAYAGTNSVSPVQPGCDKFGQLNPVNHKKKPGQYQARCGQFKNGKAFV